LKISDYDNISLKTPGDSTTAFDADAGVAVATHTGASTVVSPKDSAMLWGAGNTNDSVRCTFADNAAALNTRSPYANSAFTQNAFSAGTVSVNSWSSLAIGPAGCACRDCGPSFIDGSNTSSFRTARGPQDTEAVVDLSQNTDQG
jgi:hypothetical protein